MRQRHIDGLRGIAVLAMIEWHALDAWTVESARTGAGWWVVMFIGGWAAPVFLFLAGVSVPLAGAARVARGADVAAAGRLLVRRGWQVFLIAHLFRLQSFLFNGARRWSGILKPDILNILGLGIVATGAVWRRTVGSGRSRAWFLVLAWAVVLATPWSRTWWWPTLLYDRFEAYIRPVGNLGVFALFPWVGYIFAGAWLGSILAAHRDSQAVDHVHRWMANAGVALVLVGLAFGWGILYVPSLAFLAPPVSPFLWRGGATMLALALLYGRFPEREVWWNPLPLLGRTSLVVYWVHIEIAYGVLTRPWHRSMSLPVAVVAYLVLAAAMVGLARAWRKLEARRQS